MIALLRTEWTKAVWRTRTIIVSAALVGLPILISLAVHARGERPRREANGEGLLRLARQTGLMFPPAVLAAMSGFLLIIVAGMWAGDSVAGDASSGNLRYVLLRPVSRVKLLLAKAAVAATLIWISVFVVMIAALAAGVSFFGWHPVVVPPIPGAVGFTVSTGALLGHIGVAAGYVAFGYSALLALGSLFSTMTDNPASAIGATIGIYIVSEIIDSISAFGRLRYGLPTHYLGAWQQIFTRDYFSHDLIAGMVVQVAYVAVFGSAAIWMFHRKDVSS